MARTESGADATGVSNALADGERVLLFDMDGVVLRGRSVDDSVYSRAMVDAADDYALPVEQIDRAVLGKHAYDEAFVTACREVGLDPVDFYATREVYSAQRVVERVRDGQRDLHPDIATLDRLAGRCDLGLVSNNYHRAVAAVVDHFSLEAFSYARGRDPGVSGFMRRKPDPHYLFDALDALDASGGVYVGDRETDVVAAERAGLDSAYLRRDDDTAADLDADPTYLIESISDLETVLDSAAGSHR